MNWVVQLGDLATRLSRGLGITGNVKTELRDPMLPVAIVSDLTKPPYADEPQTYAASNSAAGTAANQPVIALLGVAPRTRIDLATIKVQGGAQNLQFILNRSDSNPGLFAPNASQALAQPSNVTGKGVIGAARIRVGNIAPGFIGGILLANPIAVAVNAEYTPPFFALPIGPELVLFPGDALYLLGAVGAANIIAGFIFFSEYSR